MALIECIAVNDALKERPWMNLDRKCLRVDGDEYTIRGKTYTI